MKKLLILLILILTPFLADARGLMMMGGGVAAGCTETTPNSQTTDNDYWLLASNDTNVSLNTSYTAAATGTIKTFYLTLDKTGTPSFTFTLAACTSDGATPPQPATCTVIGTMNTSAVTAKASYKFSYSTGYAQTSGTVYHLKLYTASSVDASNYIRWQANSGATGSGCYRALAAEASWVADDATCQHNFTLKNCVE
jgi:hypothetical protein